MLPGVGSSLHTAALTGAQGLCACENSIYFFKPFVFLCGEALSMAVRAEEQPLGALGGEGKQLKK